MVIANVFSKLQTVKILVRPLSKNRSFRRRFDSQHVKVVQIIAKYPSEHSDHLFSALWAKLIWKMSPLVFGEIFCVFVDTLPADSKYPIEHYKDLRLPIQMQLSEKRKRFSEFFFFFISGIYIKFQTFWKKKIMLIANVFPKLQTVKTSSDHSVKRALYEHALTLNMIKSPKYFQNLHESSFIMLYHHFERSWFGVYLPCY